MEHVTFQVERGTVFTILGGSGCGKSSLLRYLIGLEEPQAGRIDIDGVGEPHRYEGMPPFGVLFQSGALFSSMTLAENLALPLTAWTRLRGAMVRELVSVWTAHTVGVPLPATDVQSDTVESPSNAELPN